MRKNNLKKVVVLGLGKSGISAMRLCSRLGIACAGFDEKNIPSFNEGNSLNNSSANISSQLWNGERIPDADIIVTSPGLSLKSEMFKAAISTGIPIVSELEFASYFIDTPILAITGTNGKTTTTELTCHLLKRAGKKAVCAGNIGTPLSDFALCKEKYDFIVTEVSSFQLEHSPSFAPEAAVLLNLESDHMDRYKSFDDYAATKVKIFKNIRNQSGAIIRFDLLSYWDRFINSSQKPVTFSIKASDKSDIYFDSANNYIYINHGFSALIDISNAKLKGLHNVENMMGALALTSSVLNQSCIQAL
ncbi:MAG: UDP-N-acetylmuramoyl-L-alanine--D-glutamate ligase, partial [Candidatus Nanoarchaeia archaeon]